MISIPEIGKLNPDLTFEQIEGILYLIATPEGISAGELARETGLPKETLRRFKTSISGLLTTGNSQDILVKQDFIKDLQKIGLKPYKWRLLEYSSPVLEEKLLSIRRKFPLDPKRQYDQFFATEETSVSKVLVMKDKGAIKSKKIVLLGDDDFVSIVLGLMNETYEEILVLDVDGEILNTIEAICKEYSFPRIRTEKYDARQEPRPELLGKYDTVVIDPPYTSNGVKIFLDRALALLKPGLGKKIFLYYGNSFKSPEKFLEVQEAINKRNLLIKDKIENFARYYGAESIGSTSSLYVLESTIYSKPGNPLECKEMYTFQKPNPHNFPYVEHYVFKLYGVSKSILTSKSEMQKLLGKFCNIHKLKVVNTEVTQFPGEGFTVNYTLSSSVLSVHTWPEFKALHIILVTCSRVHNSSNFSEVLNDLFKPERVEVQRLE